MRRWIRRVLRVRRLRCSWAANTMSVVSFIMIVAACRNI
jgi:hypothetical protein